MDLTGERYGKLTVLREGEHTIQKGTNRKVRHWVCLCDCGNETVVRHGHLRNGSIKSCGCGQNIRQDFIGRKYGRLTIVAEAEDIRFSSVSVKRVFVCRCECGNVLEVRYDAMASGNTKSCGCYKREQTIASNIKNKTIHGLEHHPLYATWNGMNRRCYNKNTKHFEHYGGRGIYVCDEWRDDPTEFIRWAESEAGWFEGCGLTIDRINVHGDYEPENCRFVNQSIQGLNRRLMSSNTSGYVGVRQLGKKWHARIGHKGKEINLGTYDKLEDAVEARQIAEIDILGYLADSEPISQKVTDRLSKLNSN